MSAIVELEKLLQTMSPEIQEDEYVFCTVRGKYSEYEHLDPLATFVEPEGLTLIVPASVADKEKLKYKSKFKQIILTVHSSLNAVGLTAAISTKLASCDISANVVAAYYHDHVFVPTDKADKALWALKELCKDQ